MFFDATVNFVVGEEWYVLSPKETVCEVFDLAEAHFFLHSFGIVLLYYTGEYFARALGVIKF